MEVYLNSIHGIDDAMVSMLMSKRSWTREKEMDIRALCERVTDRNGFPTSWIEADPKDVDKFNNQLDILVKWGKKHTTLLRFIDISVTVKGLHRAGQDDWDSHAKRFDNRIIRNSTRIKGVEFGYEMSDYYKGKILPTDLALKELGVDIPDKITVDGKEYAKAVNGYILDEFKDREDVKRGLYMLSIPSDFIFKVNLTEWAHVYKQRNINSGANWEVRQLCELIASKLYIAYDQFNRDLWMEIEN